jgi:hypothetical protein
MADLLLLITVLVAFGALLGLVRLCDRIVGDDPPESATTAAPASTASAASEVAP